MDGLWVCAQGQPAYLWQHASSTTKANRHHMQNLPDPIATLGAEKRGVLSLPDVESPFASTAGSGRNGKVYTAKVGVCVCVRARALSRGPHIESPHPSPLLPFESSSRDAHPHLLITHFVSFQRRSASA